MAPPARLQPPPAPVAGADRSTLDLVRALLQLVRPGQWSKNLLVVSVPLLDLEVWRLATLGRLAWAVAAFTVAATLVYVLNDVADRRWDAANPAKRHRPIAAGRVPTRVLVMLVCCQLSLLAAVLSLQAWHWSWPIAAYLLLNAAYSLGLKHAPLLDVFLVASGFGLRLLLGYLAIGAALSGWLLTCVFSLSLLLSVGKRRQELVSTGGGYRPALRGYSVPLTEQLMLLSAVLAAGSYLLYLRTEAPLGVYGLAAAVSSVPLALFGLFRYLQLVLVRGAGENPVRVLLRDPPLIVNSILLTVLSGGFLVATRISVS